MEANWQRWFRRCLAIFAMAVFLLPPGSFDGHAVISYAPGAIVFARGSSLVRRNLETSTETTILSIDGSEEIEHLSYVSDGRILFDHSAAVVDLYRSEISLATPTSSGRYSITPITQGNWPTAIPGTSKFFFFRGSEDKRGLRLVVRDGLQPASTEFTILGVSFSMPVPVVPISSHEVVFTEDLGRAPWLFDTQSRQLRRLPIPDCWPELWISERRQILCASADREAYVLATLDGKTEPLPLDFDFIPLAIVGNGARAIALLPILEASELVVIDLSHYSTAQFIRAGEMGVGGVVWVPE